MINVNINETTLLNLLMNRLEYWISDNNALALYETYLKELIDSGYFEGVEIDINLIIDNLYINNTSIMDKEMLDDNDIEVDNNERVLAKNEEQDLYLISSY